MNFVTQSIHVAFSPVSVLHSFTSSGLYTNHFLTKAFSAAISKTAVPAGNTPSPLSYFVFSAYCCPTL